MKIGIIGTGRMGGTLAKLWAAQGHMILLGSRSPEKHRQYTTGMLSNFRVVTVAEAARHGDLILLAVPWMAAHESIEAAGPISGKILIDCTNPWSPDGEGLLLWGKSSAAEAIAEWEPYVKVVKAFNTVHWQHLMKPVFGAECANLLLCGDDLQAKEIVGKLGKEIGFEPLDAGPLKNARHLESLAYLWVYLAFREGNGTDTTFKLIRR
jgi:8-hydroxy-5-deazaflavin:NADPH oxidoreductase